MGTGNSKCGCLESSEGRDKSNLSKFFPSSLWKRENASMRKGERSIKAALLIQRWYRRYCARMEVRRMYTWSIFQSIEYAGEQDQMKLHNFFNALLTHIGHTGVTAELVEALSPRASPTPHGGGGGGGFSLDNNFDVDIETDDIMIEYGYRGYHMKFPITPRGIHDLIESLEKKKGSHILHAKYVCSLFIATAKVLSKIPTVAMASTSISGQITVIGDLHGKLDDLLTILYKNGLPSTDNPYVFNGDFVDRGKNSIEVIVLLCALVLAFPGDVYLNRGNHEDMIMNARYGFCKEVNRKYKSYGPRILRLLEELYRWLPLATVIDQKVLVVHGGISDKTDIEKISKMDRAKYISVLKLPKSREDDSYSNEYDDNYGDGDNDDYRATAEDNDNEWKQILDLLWSDPQHQCGCSPNVFRGGGAYFGPDITKNILELHGYKLLIRSHECKVDGYEYMHDDRCLTIFSASNYYEAGSNKGAYVKLQGKELQPHFVQYMADSKQKKLTIRERVGRMEHSAIIELKTHILASKAAIVQGFKAVDPDDTGLISVSDWVEVMEERSNLKIPWRTLKDRLSVVSVPPDGKVKYMTTFTEDKASIKGGRTVVDALYRHKNSLETIFRLIDKDNSGYITMDEFTDACEMISKHMNSTIPNDEIADLARSIDINKDGQIDFNEFLECFRIVETKSEFTDLNEEDD